MNRVIVIGLDGATLDLVEPWAQQGKLPVLAQLMDQGSYSPLKSVMPVLSSAAWASFMTGMNPGKHGFYDFVRREQKSYRLRPLHRGQMRGISLWKLLSYHARRVGVFNVPMTYPPEAVNGFLISGLGTPDYRAFSYPEGLYRELLESGYRVNKQTHFHPGGEDAFLQEVYKMTDAVTDQSIKLMNEHPWDFFMVVYRDTDEMAHFFWRHMDPDHPAHNPDTDTPYKDAILHYYQKIDTAVGRLVKAAGEDTTVMIMSDHGTGPLYRDVFLNEWLRDSGFLFVKNNQAMQSGYRRSLAKLGLTRENVSTTLRRLGLGKVERWLKDLLGDRIEILPRTPRAEFPQAIDWSKTRAYSFGYHGQIFINLKGREPEGIVEPGEQYGQLCEEISAALGDLKDPLDNLPVVDSVVRREEVFHGEAFEHAPDLMIIMRDLSYITRQGFEFGEQGGQIFSNPHSHQSGSHRMDGLLIMAGTDIRSAGSKMETAHLIDLAPTILHLLECPVPESMDGKVLRNWLSSDRDVEFATDISLNQVTEFSGDAWNAKEEQEMIDRLKKLGYLE
jgi:predicted AlkP superfamily phosphohydrolase/phosphomutase